MSTLLCLTRRETPANFVNLADQNLIRAGYFQYLGNKCFGFLPLGKKSLDNMQRWFLTNKELNHFQQIHLEGPGNGLSLYDDVFSICSNHVRSYRQLPIHLFNARQIDHTAQPSIASLAYAANRPVIELISLYPDQNDLIKQTEKISNSIEHFWEEFNISVQKATMPKKDPAYIDRDAWIFETPQGDEQIFRCSGCQYQASINAAQFERISTTTEAVEPIHKVATPECPTIESLAEFLGVSQSRTAKAVFLVAKILKNQQVVEQLVFVVVRGDREVNEYKLKNNLNAIDIRPANDEEIKAIGACPGYASPIGIEDALVIVDNEIPELVNLVAGSNEYGFHLKNVNYGRDYRANIIADIASAKDGDSCPHCGHPMNSYFGILIAEHTIINSGSDINKIPTYLDQNGKSQPLAIDIYQVDLLRGLFACGAQNNDSKGLCLPTPAAPYPIHIVYLEGKEETTESTCKHVVDFLESEICEPLIDERNERAGVKFNDADLIGAPVRLTISDRSIQKGGIEYKLRFDDNSKILSVEELSEQLRSLFYKK